MAVKRKKRADEQTNVSVNKSRQDIADILTKWGVTGISWIDNFETGSSTLRFRWSKGDASYTARWTLGIPSDDELADKAIDKRNGKFSQKKLERLKLNRGKREHRLLYHVLKNMFEAIEDGLMEAEEVLLPWIEHGGTTVYEKIRPMLDQLSAGDTVRMLSGAKLDDDT